MTDELKQWEYDRGYAKGRADGYSQAENDYHTKTEKDRQSSYDCGYQQGRADAISECLQIVQKIKDDYNEAKFGEQIPINYGTLCGIIIEMEQLKEQMQNESSV